MKKIEDSLYVGNIILLGGNNPSGDSVEFEKNVVLYKTSEGGYVKFDELENMTLLDDVNKVEIWPGDAAEISALGHVVMPEVDYTATIRKGTVGAFVEGYSLIPYSQLKQLSHGFQKTL